MTKSIAKTVETILKAMIQSKWLIEIPPLFPNTSEGKTIIKIRQWIN